MVPVIVGPTASGKTSVALELAKLGGNVEIISADSRQIYIGMDIGTAKPTSDELASVPHHLIDIVHPDVAYSAGAYALAARAALRDVLARGATPLVVGGSGFYIKALFEGLSAPEVDPTTMRELESRCESEGYDALVAELRSIDPVAASQHDPKNRVKTLRALACFIQTGIRYSEYAGAAGLERFELEPLYCGVTVERAELYRRINERAATMLAMGLVGEVRRLLDAGYNADAPGMRTVGYSEAIDHIMGRIDEVAMLDAIRQSTRRYAKRQTTWFKRVDVVEWYSPSASTARAILDRIRSVDVAR